jgi:hypothetical protein
MAFGQGRRLENNPLFIADIVQPAATEAALTGMVGARRDKVLRHFKHLIGQCSCPSPAASRIVLTCISLVE